MCHSCLCGSESDCDKIQKLPVLLPLKGLNEEADNIMYISSEQYSWQSQIDLPNCGNTPCIC